MWQALSGVFMQMKSCILWSLDKAQFLFESFLFYKDQNFRCGRSSTNNGNIDGPLAEAQAWPWMVIV